ncbi:MAG: BamA/TamA family outer membrane protein [Holosporaceae bacterium]|jgi:translocation and assembly module TamA|nr:BamA/TamA family outer membrane protein [Holosporaceae bacterium]
MALKKNPSKTIIIALLLIFASGVPAFESEFYDIGYSAELILKKDQNFAEAFSEIISEDSISTEIKRLRLFSWQNKPIGSMRTLRDRIGNDIKAIYRKAHLTGFYGAEVACEITPVSDYRVAVKITVDLGKPFVLKTNIRYLNKDEGFVERHGKALLQYSRTLNSSLGAIKSAAEFAVDDLQKSGFIKPEVIKKNLRIDYDTREAVLNLTIDPGEKVVFSETVIRSFPGIEDDFIRNRIAWREGDPFDIEKIRSSEENLRNTQIFSKVSITPDESALKNNKVPMIIEVREDKKHTVDFSVLYAGMRSMNFEKQSQAQKRLKSVITRLAWKRCNAFGGGERLDFTIEGTPLRVRDKRSDYAFEVLLSQPDIFLKNNRVDWSISRKQELTNVFFKKSDLGSLMFNYPIYDGLLMRTGCSLDKTYVDADEIFFRNKEDGRNYKNISVPLELILDRTDSLLNPVSGYRLSLKTSSMFFRNSEIGRLGAFDIGFSCNYSPDELKKTVFAFNLVRKSVFGQKLDDIPVDKRIYAGGMNSVRGYANQTASELIAEKSVPLGGKSSLEFNCEVRRKISGDFGLVLFCDGAKVFQNQSVRPELRIEKKRWFCSVGVGVRYFTYVGPMRFDFAFPVNRRKGADSKVQFIMSLGQAF